MNLAVLKQLSAFGNIKIKDITPEMLSQLGSIAGFNIDVDDALCQQMISALHEEDVDQLADLFSKPEIFAKIAQFMKPVHTPMKQDVVCICNRCGEINILEVQL